MRERERVEGESRGGRERERVEGFEREGESRGVIERERVEGCFLLLFFSTKIVV